MTIGVLGPAWADTSGRMEVVRNPLRVQNHVTRMVGALVPGVIATTTQACYYGLHPLVASVAHERGLDLEAVWTLIRRVEVALAWVSMHHQPHLVDIPEAHGEIEIRSHVKHGSLNLEVASRPGNYTVARAGFAGGAYFNSEFELGLLERTWTPGPRFDQRALRVTKERLAPLFDLANEDLVSAADAQALAHRMCVCTARSGDEGEWLRDLIWGRLGGERWSNPDASRRGSATLLVKAIGAAREPVQNAIDSMRSALVFSGPLESSAVAHGLVGQAGAWRGVFLRHYLVTAWRELWPKLWISVTACPRPKSEKQSPLRLTPSRFPTSLLRSLRPTVIVCSRRKLRPGAPSQESRDTSLCSQLPAGERENLKARP